MTGYTRARAGPNIGTCGPGARCERATCGARDTVHLLFDFGQGTPRVLVVLHPTARKRTLRGLDMRTTVGREEFFGLQHGDGRLKLIERLAAAYRVGDLPSYMLEFVNSLRTRATPATS